MIATGHIYKIICLIDDSFCYIGSTFDALHKRFATHKSCYKRYFNNNSKKDLISIFPYFNKYGVENFKIIKIKSYQVYRENKKDRKHLAVYETLWINKSKNCVNKKLPFNPLYKIDHKKYVDRYYQKNKEKISESKIVYYQKNKEKKKEIYQKNKEKIAEQRKKNFNCVCGSIIRIYYKKKHLESKKHREYLKLESD